MLRDLNVHSNINSEELLPSILAVLEEKCLIDSLREHSDISLEALIPFLYESHYKAKDKVAVYAYIKNDAFMRTKRRWARTAVKNATDKKAANRELKAKKTYLAEFISKFGIQQFNVDFKVESLDIYMKQAADELLTWAESDDMLIHSYPYIAEKTPKQRKNAIQYDLLMIMGEFLTNDTAFFKPTVHQSPNFALNTSFFGLNPKAKLALSKENPEMEDQNFETSESKSYYKVEKRNKFSTNANVNMLVSSDFVKDLNKSVPDLDTKDFELFIEILGYRDANFRETRRIVFPLKKVVQHFYKSDSSKNYELAIQRLLKLSNYRLNEIDGENSRFEMKGLIQRIIIDDAIDKDNGEKIVTVFVTDNVFEDYMKQQVTNIHSDKVAELKGHFAYHLVFILQRERIVAHNMGEPNPVRRDLLSFRHAVRFNKRTKKENIQQFEQALDKIKERQFIIKDYYRSGDYYFFTFFPLSNLELEDVTLNQDNLQ